MAAGKRVMFTFDDRSYGTLKRITEEGKFSSMADTVRDSLMIAGSLQNQSQEGFTEVIVRNPKTNEKRIITIPSLLPSGS